MTCWSVPTNCQSKVTKHVSHYSVAWLMAILAWYSPGQEIRLLSCSTNKVCVRASSMPASVVSDFCHAKVKVKSTNIRFGVITWKWGTNCKYHTRSIIPITCYSCANVVVIICSGLRLLLDVVCALLICVCNFVLPPFHCVIFLICCRFLTIFSWMVETYLFPSKLNNIDTFNNDCTDMIGFFLSMIEKCPGKCPVEPFIG